MSAPLRVHFVHGLESSPQSSKALYLAERFDSVTPAMDTSNFEGAVALHTEALARRPVDVLVGSSFGGAVALALVQRGAHRGATVLLAGAHRHYAPGKSPAGDGVPEHVTNGVPVVLVHGLADTVVSPDGSRALAKTGTPGLVELVLVEDDHRLATLLRGSTLEDLVRRAYALGRS